MVGENIQIRSMTQEDIALGMKLKSFANWNQRIADWQLLINAGEGGNFVAMYKGQPTGTTTTLTYQERFSWIGMVLVDPAFRGLGIGTALLKKAITFAKRKGTVRLDATPEGKKLYATLGFETERTLVRLARNASDRLLHPRPQCHPVTMDTLQALTEFDTPVFSANRGMVLRHLFHHAPEYAFCVERKGKLTGYCLGRSGSDFEQIGPIITENLEDARDLLLTAMASCQPKPVIVDVFTENSHWLEVLASLGFKTQRPLIRMYLGALTHPGNPDWQYAIAGPELG